MAPRAGMAPFFARERTVSSVRALGERPELAMAASLPAFGSQTKAKQSPPRPELVGSTKPRTALAAMAASTAEPPRLSMAMAACVARGCAVPAAPEQPSAGERVVKLAPEGRSPACTSGRMKRSWPAAWNCGKADAGAPERLLCGDAATFSREFAAAPRGAKAEPAKRQERVWMKVRRRMGASSRSYYKARNRKIAIARLKEIGEVLELAGLQSGGLGILGIVLGYLDLAGQAQLGENP